MISVLLCIRNNGQCFTLTLCVFLFVSHSAGESGRPCPTHDHRSSSGVSDHPDVPTSCTGLSGEPHPHFNLSITGTVLTPWLSLKINMLCSTVLWRLWSDWMYSWMHHVNAWGLVSRWKLHTSTNCCSWSFWCTAPCVFKNTHDYFLKLWTWTLCILCLQVMSVLLCPATLSNWWMLQKWTTCLPMERERWGGASVPIRHIQDQKVYLFVFSETGDSSTKF